MNNNLYFFFFLFRALVRQYQCILLSFNLTTPRYCSIKHLTRNTMCNHQQMQLLRANGTNHFSGDFKGKPHWPFQQREETDTEINKLLWVVQIDPVTAWMYALLQNTLPRAAFTRWGKKYIFMLIFQDYSHLSVSLEHQRRRWWLAHTAGCISHPSSCLY